MGKVLLSNYQNRYRSYTFRGKREGEEIILLLRQHWLILVLRFIPILIYIIVLIVLHFLSPAILASAGMDENPQFVSLVESTLYMFLWLIIFIVWLDYYLDVWIVTDQRIIDIEQQGLFRRQISELEHTKIQDVTSEVHGVIPTLFNFGHIFVQTAGERARFEFRQIPDPVKVRNVVMQLQQWAVLQEKKKEGEIFRGKI